MLRKSMLSGFLFLYAGTMGIVWSEENSSLDLDFNETARETPNDFNDTPKETKDTKRSLAYVIPIKDQIGAPVLDILRRGIKDAIKAKATTVVLDMDTPGGELGVTLEMMQEIHVFFGMPF